MIYDCRRLDSLHINFNDRIASQYISYWLKLNIKNLFLVPKKYSNVKIYTLLKNTYSYYQVKKQNVKKHIKYNINV